MNRTAALIFDALKVDMLEYRRKLSETLAEYRAAKEKALVYSRDFKDEQSVYSSRMVEPRQRAKQAVAEAAKSLRKEMDKAAADLRAELNNHLTEPMNPGFARKLRVYNDFSIPLSRMELRALLQENGGNTTGIRALAATLEKTGSKSRIECRSIDEYDADIKQIERRAELIEHNPCFSLDEIDTALEIYRNEPLFSLDSTGKAFRSGVQIDGFQLIMEATAFDSLVNALDKKRDIWRSDISYTVQDAVDEALTAKEHAHEEAVAEIEGREPQFEPVPESTTQIENDGIQIGRELGAEKAAGNRLFQDSPYVK